MMVGMATAKTITAEDLAEMSAVAFYTPSKTDVPDKIWIDFYQGVNFIRAAWASGITAERIAKLEALQGMLAKRYRGRFVAVAYWTEPSWEDVDAHAAALQAVK